MKSVRERLLSFDEYNEKLDIEAISNKLDKCLNCSNPYCSSKMVLDNKLVGCPIGLKVPEVISLMKYGMYKEAYDIIKEATVFPEILSRICNGYCEISCLNSKENTSTEIKNIIRTLADYGLNNNFEQYSPPPKNGKNVAIIGSGLSGLVCADYLIKRGYNVTVYEKDMLPGGTLMNGTPNMRLDKNIVFKRINMLKSLGVEFLVDTEVSRVISPIDVMKDNDAVILATGVKQKNIMVEGRTLKNVIYATDYLKKVNYNVLDKGFSDIMKDKSILVVGSGKTASDVIATALREKAQMVATIDIKPIPPLKRRNFWPMESDALEIDYAIEEARYKTCMDPRGYSTALVEIEGNKEVSSVKVVGVDYVDGNIVYSANGMTFPMDYVLIATGSNGAEKELLDQFKINILNDFIANDNHKNNENVFICGDAYLDNGISIMAVNDALRCAKEVLEYLEA